MLDVNKNGEIDWSEFVHHFGRYDCLASNPQQAPNQIHLSLTNQPTEMRVMWVSKGTGGKALWCDASSYVHTC